ncbi:MAG: hypothetical protein JWO31_1052, partial [Phycisphaerales bacterium]|nr:hypothetical protein [Phycisphaerales bacterium]
MYFPREARPDPLATRRAAGEGATRAPSPDPSHFPNLNATGAGTDPSEPTVTGCSLTPYRSC